MFNYRMIAILKRELRERLLSKGFIIMTILMPVFMFGIIGIQALLAMYETEGNKIEFVAYSDSIATKLDEALQEYSFVKDSSVIPTVTYMSKTEFEDYLSAKRDDLLNEKITGIVYIPDNALSDKNLEYYSKTPKNFRLLEKIDGPINKVLIETYFSSKNIPPEELNFARSGVDFKSFKISEEEEIKEEGYGGLILAYVLSFLLYISLLMMGSMVMQTVIQEKTNRIVEVLLSSVTSRELMTGKILGAAITGFIQMAIWLSPIVVIASSSWAFMPPEITLDMTTGKIIYFLFNFFIGLMIFIGLFATVGSIFENPQDAQSGMWPIMLLIMIPFFIAISMMQNPDNPIANIASLLPFSAVIVMPAKMQIADVPLWQLIFATVVNVATFLVMFPISGKIYRVGIMMTGKKPKWSEVVKWLKYKY